MADFILKVFALGELYTNCYVVYDKKQKRGFIIDAPAPYGQVIDFVNKEKLNIEFIALTHGHFDHINGLNEVSFPFYMHKADGGLLKSSELNGSGFFNSSVKVDRPPALFLEETKPIDFSGSKIEVIHTPGHTPGSVCIKAGQWLFSGDTLFFGSIGRTDVPLGSYESIIKSIKEKLVILPEDTVIYPGHGKSSTIAEEIVSNPFLK
ncbi:MAG: MBL fold metallo-hydrolase [Candidatus Omnitrophota bacterium]